MTKNLFKTIQITYNETLFTDEKGNAILRELGAPSDFLTISANRGALVEATLGTVEYQREFTRSADGMRTIYITLPEKRGWRNMTLMNLRNLQKRGVIAAYTTGRMDVSATFHPNTK